MKLLDIDNTVAKGVENIAKNGSNDAHAARLPQGDEGGGGGGEEVRIFACSPSPCSPPWTRQDMVAAGYEYDPHTLVLRRSEQALQAGMGGIVCSAGEASAVRKIVGPDLAVVTPGIRPIGSDHGDQKRVVTPAEAISAGASHLVVARPIVASIDRKAAAEAILAEMQRKRRAVHPDGIGLCSSSLF